MLPLVVVVLPILLLFVGAVIDIGEAYKVRQQLQASADAAALAGAQRLPDPAAAVATAHQFGSGSGAKNGIPDLSNTSVDAQAVCDPSFPSCAPANSVSVSESGQMDTTFLSLLGIDKIDVSASAKACSPCGTGPLDVMLVLDRTGSMCQAPNGAPDPACTDLNNAKDGMRTFLTLMDPKVDRIGMAVFPPATDLSTRCAPSTAAAYNQLSSPYVLVPLSSDYAANGQLNQFSDLVSTINCVKAGGSTAYATALEQAQAALDAQGRPGVPHIIILLSDGAANTGPSYYGNSSPYRTQPCHQGVWSAAGIKATGTIVYSIGYDLSAAGARQCTSYNGASESPAITSDVALQQIASPGNFYNQPTPSDLSGIFAAVAYDIAQGVSRLYG